jgi:hypothetical protein
LIDFLLGVAATAALYTFAPKLATVPSGWLRKAVEFFKPTGRTGG